MNVCVCVLVCHFAANKYLVVYVYRTVAAAAQRVQIQISRIRVLSPLLYASATVGWSAIGKRMHTYTHAYILKLVFFFFFHSFVSSVHTFLRILSLSYVARW